MPVRRRSEWTTTASSESSSSGPGQPVTSAYRNPWKVKVGSKKSSPPLSTNRSVACASRNGPRPQLAVLEHLGVPDPDLGTLAAPAR